MNMWLTQINSLATRTPPTRDEVKDEKNASVRRERLAAMREAKSKESAALKRKTEKHVLSVVNAKPGIGFVELSKAINATESYTRTIAKQMLTEGRLRCSIGAGCKKLWWPA